MLRKARLWLQRLCSSLVIVLQIAIHSADIEFDFVLMTLQVLQLHRQHLKENFQASPLHGILQ